jgi:hypothetical protein
MQPIRGVYGEGASAPGFGSRVAPVPSLVLWPMFTPGVSVAPESLQQIYQLAYEWAQAALRSSWYERSQRMSWN